MYCCYAFKRACEAKIVLTYFSINWLRTWKLLVLFREEYLASRLAFEEN